MIATDRVESEKPVGLLAEDGEPARRPAESMAGRALGAKWHVALWLWAERYSSVLLRLSMGAIIFGFGVLKYFPGVSPAQGLVLATTNVLTFGLMPAHLAMVLFATVECAIGLSLITGIGLRFTIYPLLIWAIGILSPIVLMPERLFSGPGHAPTLEGQYVLKDIVLLSASLLIATKATSGQRR